MTTDTTTAEFIEGINSVNVKGKVSRLNDHRVFDDKSKVSILIQVPCSLGNKSLVILEVWNPTEDILALTKGDVIEADAELRYDSHNKRMCVVALDGKIAIK